MFQVHGNDIYISAGDTATFTVTPYEDDGVTEYVMEANEFLRLTVRPRGFSDREIFHIDSELGYTSFTITAEQTRKLRRMPIARYDYDIALMYPDGSKTVIIGATPNFVPHFVVLGGDTA